MGIPIERIQHNPKPAVCDKCGSIQFTRTGDGDGWQCFGCNKITYDEVVVVAQLQEPDADNPGRRRRRPKSQLESP